MTNQELYTAFYKAFLASGREMGEELKGLSCLYRNWRHENLDDKQDKQAA